MSEVAPQTVDRIRALDQWAIETLGVPGVVLMENAGRAAADVLVAEYLRQRRRPVVILCGAGNNGGDGFVIARHLLLRQFDVRVILGVPRANLRGDAAVNADVWRAMRGKLEECSADSAAAPFSCGGEPLLVVDALLGTGATGNPRGTIGALIEAANACPAARVAVDLPSGLDGDSGAAATPCFRADLTITMAAPKVGFARAAEWTGRIVLVDIGVPAEQFFSRAT